MVNVTIETYSQKVDCRVNLESRTSFASGSIQHSSNSAEFAIHDARSALGTLILVYLCDLLLLPDNSARGAISVAHTAHLAFFFNDYEIDQVWTNKRRAVFLTYMCVIFVAKISYS